MFDANLSAQKMSSEELGEIIEGGLEKLEMKIDYSQRKEIIKLSAGYPNYTHMLCKYSVLKAIQDEVNMIGIEQFRYSVRKAIENSSQSLTSAFQTATISSKSHTLFLDVLYSVGNAEVDEYGCSSKRDILDALYNITGVEHSMQKINYYFNQLCRQERGEILIKIGEKNNVRFKFRNPMMKAFTLLKISC